MRTYARAAAVAALLAVVAAPAASFARQDPPPGQCTIKYQQVTSKPLPGGLGVPYFDCTY